MADKKNANKIGRDAGTGQYIPVEKAIKMGNKAVVETRKTPKK